MQTIEADLIRRAMSGDRVAFGTLWRSNLDRVCRAVIGGVSRDEQNDIIQEAFWKAWHGLSGYSDWGKFGSWIATVARSAKLDFLRSRGREAEFLHFEAQIDQLVDKVLLSEDPSAEDVLARSEMDGCVRNVIEAVRTQVDETNERVLDYMLGKYESLSELAEHCGMTKQSLAARAKKLRSQLQRRLLRCLRVTTEGL